jgi:hypothetical protein
MTTVSVIIVTDFRFVVTDFRKIGVATGTASKDHSEGCDQSQFKASSEQHCNISVMGLVFGDEVFCSGTVWMTFG